MIGGASFPQWKGRKEGVMGPMPHQYKCYFSVIVKCHLIENTQILL